VFSPAQYIKAYALALKDKIKEETQAPPKPDWHLLERPESKDNLKTGLLVKEGAIRKNWKQRYFVVKYDYTIDYYESEEAYKNQQPPKGTIAPAGYWVNEDVEKTMGERLRKLAESMGVGGDEVGEGKKYPEHTFEVYHSRRRSFYICAASEQEKQDWVRTFKECCWRAYGLLDRDPVHVRAFRTAVRKTRWELGHWGWWSYGGSETQILTDLITYELDYQVMSKIYGRITGSWRVRYMVRDKLLKALDTMIDGAVRPAWSTMKSTVDKFRPSAEEKMKTLLEPLFKLEGDLVDKMKNGVMSVVKPVLEEKVAPHFGRILNCLTGPMRRAYEIIIHIYEKKVDDFASKMTPGGGNHAELFKELGRTARSYWELREAFNEVDSMYDPLWLLRDLFADIYPWRLISTAHDDLRNVLSKAFYTFEQAVDKSAAENSGSLEADVKRARDETLVKLKHDARLALGIYYKDIINSLVSPPFQKEVIPRCQSIIEPLASAVPENLQEFVDLNRMVEDLINGIVEESIAAIVDPNIAKVDF
jgi:hypothetical protein